MSFFFDMPSELMAALGTVLGFALLGDLNSNQQNSLGNFLMLIAQVLETSATQQQLLDSQKMTETANDHESRIKRLEEALRAQSGNNQPFSKSGD
ncbi:MAG: hypothetical protein VB078_04615 [Clostridiaceae bacterium]|nr:hypothetical protein [Clostridiaceae bacterium]